MRNQNQNKKREHNAPLFKTVVSINNDGNLIINHEYPNPKKIVERLNADIGVEELPLFADLERRMKEMAEKTEQGNA